MLDYLNGKIYKIVNSSNDTIYIGSTAHPLHNRFGCHRWYGIHRKEYSPLYRAMNEIGVNRFDVVLVKSFPCCSKQELVAEEYRIMNHYRDVGHLLYNAAVKASKISSKRNRASNMVGSLHPQFIRGSIMFDPVRNRWRYKWKQDGKHMQKSFSCMSWGGSWSAHKMCIAWQDYIYPPK
jgi:hypothetical protein